MPSIKFIKSDLNTKLKKLANNYPVDVRREMESIARDAVADFEKVTSTWSTPVKFKVSVGFTQGGARKYQVSTTDPRFIWTDKGTRKHIIKPKRRGGVLRFKVGGKAKSSPNSLQAYKGADGKSWRSAKVVRHPGTTPRNFTINIYNKWRPQVAKRVARVLSANIRGK